MRLFAALIPPEAALDELAEEVSSVRSSWPALRWLSRELWHVTLAFYGELDETACELLLPRLEAAARAPAPTLSFSGAGVFPKAAPRSRVLWTGLSGDLPALARLAATATAAGLAAGAQQLPHRSYHAHLTLARSRVPRDLRPLTHHLSTFSGTPWTAPHLHLILSHHGTPRYHPLATWPLPPS